MPAHSPLSPATATRVRVRWDNVMIVLIGAAVAACAVVYVVMSGPGSAAKPSPAKVPGQQSEPTRDAAPATGQLDIEDARSLVEEARTLMADARWAEAADRLDSVPADLREIVGSTALAAEVTTKSDAWKLHRTRLDAAVETKDWAVARTELDELSKLARLDTQLVDLDATIDRELASVARPPAPKEPAAAKTSGGGAATPATSAPKPAATKPKPGATKPKPKPGATTPKPGTGLPDLGEIELTPAQQAELEQALQQALAGAA